MHKAKKSKAKRTSSKTKPKRTAKPDTAQRAFKFWVHGEVALAAIEKIIGGKLVNRRQAATVRPQ